MTFLVLQQQVNLELTITPRTIGNRCLLELVEGIATQAVGNRIFQTQTITLRFVLNIHLLHFLIHYSSKTLGIGLRSRLICEFEVEVVGTALHIGKGDRELGRHIQSILGILHRGHELILLEFLTRDTNNTVHLLHHVDSRSIKILRSNLHQVAHIIAI